MSPAITDIFRKLQTRLNMTFTCRECGTCCMYLGDYIVIDHQIGPFEFACESVSTGTTFTARVDEDKREFSVIMHFRISTRILRFSVLKAVSCDALSITIVRHSASSSGV